MKLYVMQGARYTEDGDLTPYSKVFVTLEAAKAALVEDYEENSRWDVGTEDEIIDTEAWLAGNHMRWGSSGAMQSIVEIVEHEIKN